MADLFNLELPDCLQLPGAPIGDPKAGETDSFAAAAKLSDKMLTAALAPRVGGGGGGTLRTRPGWGVDGGGAGG